MKTLLHSILSLFLVCGVTNAEEKAPPVIKAREHYKLSITGIPNAEKGRYDGIYPVIATGCINVPFAKQVQIMGLTVPQAEKAIEDALKGKGVYRDPHITLKLSEDVGLPSRDPAVVLPLLRSFKSVPRIEDIEKILGRMDKDVGSGLYHLIYLLDDGTSILVWGSNLKHLPVIDLMKDGQKNEVIYDGTKKPERAGTDKPLTKPADKEPAKGQPSPYTDCQK